MYASALTLVSKASCKAEAVSPLWSTKEAVLPSHPARIDNKAAVRKNNMIFFGMINHTPSFSFLAQILWSSRQAARRARFLIFWHPNTIAAQNRKAVNPCSKNCTLIPPLQILRWHSYPNGIKTNGDGRKRKLDSIQSRDHIGLFVSCIAWCLTGL